jgi:signal transduction histidine kinase/ligand-binding sensor domain-containing protein
MSFAHSRRYTLLCALGILLLPLLARAAPSSESPSPIEEADTLADFTHRVWTKSDGLPDNEIHAILQTHDGYLWIATRAGLARFDGVKFTVFNRVNHPEMSDDYCISLAQDGGGNLWVGTDYEIFRWDGRSFTRVSTDDDGWARSRLLSDDQGRIWSGSGIGLTCFEHGSSKSFRLESTSLLAIDKTGTIWLGGKEFRSYDPDSGRTEVCELPAGQETGGVVGVAPDRGGLTALCIGPGNEGRLSRFEAGKWIPLSGFRQIAYGGFHTLSAYVSPFFRDSNGGVWFPAEEIGIDCFRSGAFTRYPIPWGVAHDVAYCIYEDREGSIWIGAEKSGLHCLHPKIVRSLSTRDGFLHPNTWTISQGIDSSAWIGTDGGITEIQKDAIRAHYTTTNGLPKDSVRAFAEDQRHTFWIGTGNGLCSFREGKFQLHSFPHFDDDPIGDDSGAWGKIRAILPIEDGSLWFGLACGLIRVRGGTNIFYELNRHPPQNPFFEKRVDVRALFSDSLNNLWVGTDGAGLFCLNLKSLDLASQFEMLPQRKLREDREGRKSSTDQVPLLSQEHANDPHYLRTANFPMRVFTPSNGLSSDRVWCLYEDSDHILWVGTERGLNRLKLEDRPGEVLDSFPISKAKPRATDESQSLAPAAAIFSYNGIRDIPSESINYILEDESANLWLSTDHGIWRTPKSELNALAESPSADHVGGSVLFDEADGMPATETNGQKAQPAGCKMRDGTLWFPTTNGVAIIDPRKIKLLPPAPVVIERAIIDGQDMKMEATGVRRAAPKSGHVDIQSLQASAPPRLDPGRGRVLEFHYTACSFVEAERILFQYKLEGYDSDWQDAGTRRVAYYTNLSPGGYNFRVRACNHHNVWNPTGASFAFYLTPFFYRTPWFYTACATVLIGISFSAYGLILKFKRLEKEAALGRQRKQIGRDIHDGVGGSLTRIVNLSEQTRRSLHRPNDIEARTQEISEIAIQAITQLSEIVWANNPKYDTLDNLVAYCREHATKYFADTSSQLEIHFPEWVPSRPLSGSTRHHIFLIFKEALTNIRKHAHASRVIVRLVFAQDTLSMIVIDNGNGFNPSGQSEGNGLSNMRERAAQLAAEFTIETKPTHGTTISFRVKLDH